MDEDGEASNGAGAEDQHQDNQPPDQLDDSDSGDEVPELVSDESEYETLEEDYDEEETDNEIEAQRREGGVRLIPRILQMFRHSTTRRDDADSTDAADDVNRGDVTFDRCLPSRHLYLGEGSEVQGRTVFDEDEVHSLPLLYYPYFILMPGQQFPLTLFDSGHISMVRTLLSGNKTFGMISAHTATPDLKGTIGTTAEIFEYGEVSQEEGQTLGLKIKAKGRQRFLLQSTHTDASGMKMGLVKMLPEISVGSPLCPLYSNRLRSCDRKGAKSLKINLRALSPLPSFVHMMYDSQDLVKRVHNSLKGYGWASDCIPSDPEELSFWLAANLPIQDAWKYHLLRINSCVQRLRLELCILSLIKVINCRRCSTVLADQADIFSMSSDGPQGAFVNPGGHLHETLTVYKAKRLKLVGNPSTEYSWFPGYAWTIIECARCFNHIGWKFTATKDNLKPNKFYGFSRKSISSELDGRAASQLQNQDLGENDIAVAAAQPADISQLVM